MPKAVLSPKQFALIVYIYLLGNSMIFLPEMLFAEKDTWISTLLGTLFAFCSWQSGCVCNKGIRI